MSRSNILRPLHSFIQWEGARGVLLAFFAVVALIWSNLPNGNYDHIWHATLAGNFGLLSVPKSPLHWINDGLMAIFFFVVGLEIKREILTGELSTLKKAAFPISAALGGMIIPDWSATCSH